MSLTADAKVYSDIARKLQGKEIGVLINNVGRSYDHAECLHEVDLNTVNVG